MNMSKMLICLVIFIKSLKKCHQQIYFTLDELNLITSSMQQVHKPYLVVHLASPTPCRPGHGVMIIDALILTILYHVDAFNVFLQ